MQLKTIALGLLALSGCQSAPSEAPLKPDEAFADVRFEFDS